MLLHFCIVQNDLIPTLDRLLTAQELADYIGVPLATVYSWRRRNNGPPGFRVGRHLRYRWSEVEEWISERIRVGATG